MARIHRNTRPSYSIAQAAPAALLFLPDSSFHRLFRVILCLFEVSAASPGVDHTGEDLAAVLAPNHVSHNFVCPAILCLYLLQWAGGFLLHQFKFPLRHQLLNVSNTGQIVLWGVKFSPCLNVSAVLAHSGRLLTQIPAGISLFILCDFFRSAGAAWIRSGSPSRTPHRACPPHSQTPYPTGFGPDTSWACRSEDR